MNDAELLQWLEGLDACRVPSDSFFFGYHTVEPGWSVSYPNGLTEHLIYLVVSGSCSGTAHGSPVRLGPGSVLWLQPAVRFALWSGNDQRMALYRFRLLPSDGAEPAQSPVLLLRNAWELRGTFDALVAELGSSMRFRAQRIRGLLIVLFAAIFRLSERRQSDHPLDAAQRRIVEEYVDAHIGERPTVHELAALVGLSSDYFVRRFRNTLGDAPKTWLVRRRIQHAALRLDESTDSITRVATSLGYPDVSLFSRQFKAVMGISPRAYLTR